MVFVIVGLIVAALDQKPNREDSEHTETTDVVRAQALSKTPSQRTKFSGNQSEARWLRRYGWFPRDRGYQGRFRIGQTTYLGRVECRNGGFEVHIKDPPTWMRTRRHRAGWKRIDDKENWWWLHQSRFQGTVAETIRAMETFILQKKPKESAKEESEKD